MPYAELHCKTNFSFLEGASFADELVQTAASLNLSALAITDRNSLCGVVRAHMAAKEAKLKLLIGAEIAPVDGPPILLYAKDRAGYGRLSRLITTGRRRSEKGECSIQMTDIAAHAGGLYGVALCKSDARDHLSFYKEAFGTHLYLAAEAHLRNDDKRKIAGLQSLSEQTGVPLVVCNDVHYHDASRRMLQDILVCIRHGCTIQEAGARLFSNGERCLKSEQDLLDIFSAYAGPKTAAEWLSRTQEISSACTFVLDELRYEYPAELAPDGTRPIDWLTQLTWQGARDFWPAGVPEKVRRQIEHELALIAELRYEAYFLTVWDLVKFARSRNILCQGRGSAANSAVCFCLGITSVDPARTDVLFERFVSRERAEAPDIDVDFEHERREEVMQYVYEKYGRERAGIVAEVISYRPKSAVRDIGKALGMSLDRVDLLASVVDAYGTSEQLPERIREAGLDPGEQSMQQLINLCRELLGFPRHLSQHVGGFVITGGPLCELVPIENARMEDRTVIEWDKDDIDDLGILKVDCLALGMLTAIHRCLDLVNALRAVGIVRGGGAPVLTLATIPAEDPAVYEMCCRADTIGVFQIESRAQMSMLPRLKPRCFYDLVIEVSIVRPGPIQGGMVHPYLKRRAGEEAVTYPNEAIKAVLEKTLGVPLFQEQVMRMAMVAAGFTPGEADQLRRAMGAWRRPGIIEKMRDKMLDGMLKNGLPCAYAESVFEMVRGFGEYGFPESHAASFALLVYASAWLKLYYPAAFTTALLNSQPMGFYAPAQLVRDAQNHGVKVLPVDVNESDWDCALLDEKTLRLGFRMVKGLSYRNHVEPILKARSDAESGAGEKKPFASISDFARRTGFTRAILSRLAAADAFHGLNVERREALWQVLAQHEELPLFQELSAEEPVAVLEKTPLHEHISQDYETVGLSLKAHPLSVLREDLNKTRIIPCAELEKIKDGSYVRVAGLVLVRQRPETASGVIFMTIEDETGQANVILWPKVFAANRKVSGTSSAVIVEGKLQREGLVTHIIARKLRDLSESLPDIQWRSRDFH
ncbi:MAG TPA: error-prone DNA polymerase [Planctomycetota bacterium]|nr:error-prone DNA polymerase [Planctomycetota bacterium]